MIPQTPLSAISEWIKLRQIDIVVQFDDFNEELRELCYKKPIEMDIFSTVTYSPGISTSEIIARCRALQKSWLGIGQQQRGVRRFDPRVLRHVSWSADI